MPKYSICQFGKIEFGELFGARFTNMNCLFFIIISTVLSSWAPPGFSCPYFINYMKITVFIDIVTPNGLLNFMIFSIFLQIPNYRKNKENMNYHVFICISIVLSSWAPPMHMFFSSQCSKQSIQSVMYPGHILSSTHLTLALGKSASIAFIHETLVSLIKDFLGLLFLSVHLVLEPFSDLLIVVFIAIECRYVIFFLINSLPLSIFCLFFMNFFPLCISISFFLFSSLFS